MTPSQTPPQKPGFFSRFLRFLFRLFLAVLFGGLLGAALFYGIPLLYQQFVQPVQEHTREIQALQDRLDSVESLAAERIAALTARLETVERESDAHKAAAAELETLKEQQAAGAARLPVLETSVAEQQVALATLEASLQSVQDSTGQFIKALNLSLESLDQRIADLESAQESNVTVSEMRRQLQLLQSMQLMLRAEFFLSQNNYGLAAQDIQAAIERLSELSASLPADSTAISEIIGYLEGALADLPSFPVVAGSKLSTAWQILLSGLRQPGGTPSPAPADETPPAGTPEPDTTPAPTPTASALFMVARAG